MQKPIIERVRIQTSASAQGPGLPPGFLFDVAATRLMVAGPMNPEWSETVKLSEDTWLEIFSPSAVRSTARSSAHSADRSAGTSPAVPLARLAAGAPSAVTFRQRVPVGTPSVQYLVAVRRESATGAEYLPPTSVVEVEPGPARFANVIFGSGADGVRIHVDVVQ